MDGASDDRHNGHLPDYYDILGVPEFATFSEIKSAYWRMAFSPDHRPDLPRLNAAYEVLGSEERREAYDAQRDINGIWMKDLGRDRRDDDPQDRHPGPWR